MSAASNSGTLVPSERSSACAAPGDVFVPKEWMVWSVSVSCAFAEPESHAALPVSAVASNNKSFVFTIGPPWARPLAASGFGLLSTVNRY